MNTNFLRTARIRTITGLLLAAVVTTASASALAAPDGQDPSDVPANHPTPATQEWTTRQEWRDLAARMPAGWPATQALLEAASEPLGTPHERARWQVIADNMPADWTATVTLRTAAAWPAV